MATANQRLPVFCGQDTTELSFVRALEDNEMREESSLVMTSSGVRNSSMLSDSLKVSSTSMVNQTVPQIIDDSQYVTNRECFDNSRQSVAKPRDSLRQSAGGGKLGDIMRTSILQQSSHSSLNPLLNFPISQGLAVMQESS